MAVFCSQYFVVKTEFCKVFCVTAGPVEPTCVQRTPTKFKSVKSTIAHRAFSPETKVGATHKCPERSHLVRFRAVFVFAIKGFSAVPPSAVLTSFELVAICLAS